MDFIINNLSLVLVIVTLLTGIVLYKLSLSTTKRQIGKILESLNKKEKYKTSPEKTYLITFLLSDRTKCINVYKGEIIVSSAYNTRYAPVHAVYSLDDTSEVNFWRGYAEIIPNNKISKTNKFFAKFVGDTAFSTFPIQTTASLGLLAPLLNGGSATAQLRGELENAGFVVTSHKPHQPVSNAILVILLVAVIIIGFFLATAQH